MKPDNPQSQYGVRVKNDGYAASLELRKIYRLIPDEPAALHKLVRVVAESGEDYSYPADYLVPISAPEQALPAFA